MLNLEAIQEFCSCNIEGRLGKPWTKDGFTYASDGFVLLRVPALEVDPGGNGVACAQLYEKAGPMPESGWADFPPLPEPIICPKCENGEKHPPCEECDGTGEVTLSNSYSTYNEIECASCDGSGEGEECPECCGHGFIEPEQHALINGVAFKVYQLRRLAALPGSKIAPVKGQINWVRFDGGDALIMPIVSGNGC